MDGGECLQVCGPLLNSPLETDSAWAKIYQGIIMPQASNFQHSNKFTEAVQLLMQPSNMHIILCFYVSILQWHQLSVIILSLFIIFFS